MRRALVTALLAAVLAGCGGDDGLSADEYRERARAICEQSNRATDDVDVPARTTNAALAEYFGRLLRVNEQSSERFAELDPPDDLKDAHEQALAANREGVEEVRRLIEELEGGKNARLVLQGAQARIEELRRRVIEAARRLDVPECASEE